MSEQVSSPSPPYRLPRRRGLDRATRRLALIAVGLGLALLAIVGVWSASGHHGAAVPVIEADSRPLRVKPDNPGGLQVAGANDETLSAGSSSDKLLPPPEAPNLRALNAETLRPPEPPTAPALAPSPPPAAALSGRTATVSEASPAVQPAPVEHRPAAAPAKGPAKGAVERPQVQLAALDSQQAATEEWQRLSKRMPDMLSGRQPAIQKAERDGRTVWRLRTGGFDDIAQATAFCERVRSKGGGCSLAAF